MVHDDLASVSTSEGECIALASIINATFCISIANMLVVHVVVCGIFVHCCLVCNMAVHSVLS